MSCKTRKVHVTVMLDPGQLEALDRLSTEAKVSKSKLVREGLDRFLEALAE